VVPRIYGEMASKHYRRWTSLAREHDVNLISLDSDGKIDEMIPIWFENGVNVMFPIEVGTWNGNIAPWRKTYGRELRGLGGMAKHVLALDKQAVDAEIERLHGLVDLGGFLPCPDHAMPPDTRWDLCCYYTEKMRKIFG